MDEREHRIRARAHRIWLDQGSPEGRAEEHWEAAKLQVDQEDQQAAAASDAARSGDEIRGDAADAGISAAIGGGAAPAVARKAAPRKSTRRAKEAGTP